MPKDVEEISTRIASSGAFDGYSTWRILKTIDSEIKGLGRANRPVPIELARLRSIIARARELRRRRFAGAAAGLSSVEPPVPSCDFDLFDFIDRYRALGGRRLAVDLGAEIALRQWDHDTAEAAALWDAAWSAATPTDRAAITRALLIRGRF